MKDENGVEIKEGDTLEYTAGITGFAHPYKTRGVVKKHPSGLYVGSRTVKSCVNWGCRVIKD